MVHPEMRQPGYNSIWADVSGGDTGADVEMRPLIP